MMNMDFAANYTMPWLIVGVAAVLGALCLNHLLAKLGGKRNLYVRSLRWAFVVTVLAAFTIPAPVPNAQAVFAPAFIVLIFEAAFQAQGAPEEALRLMISTLPMVFVGAVPVFFALQWPWRHAGQSSAPAAEAAEAAEAAQETR